MHLYTKWPKVHFELHFGACTITSVSYTGAYTTGPTKHHTSSHSTAQHCTAPHSTAQHCTALHNTTQHLARLQNSFSDLTLFPIYGFLLKIRKLARAEGPVFGYRHMIYILSKTRPGNKGQREKRMKTD